MFSNVIAIHLANISAALRKSASSTITLLTLSAALFAATLFGSVRAENGQPTMVPNHAYVHYTALNVPAATGTLQDVTSCIGDDGHVIDPYGYNLTIGGDYAIR